MPLACSRRHLGGLEPMHRARQFSQLFLGCIFKERPAQMDMENPPAWFHWSFLFLVNLAALFWTWSCFSWVETEAAADLYINMWGWGFNGVSKRLEHVALRRCWRSRAAPMPSKCSMACFIKHHIVGPSNAQKPFHNFSSPQFGQPKSS